MSKIEPTYLRYIYDGLNKGSINSQNASSLPNGFIGLFEEAFSSDKSVSERSSLLNRLGLWALFKGPVSCDFVSKILEEDEEKTKALVDEYSKWFNSPSPGKYILYHDRLRTYLIQKLSNHESQALNEKIISHLEQVIKNGHQDEAEEYALEHLSTHMYVESQLDKNYERFHEYVNNELLWPRQIQVSREYKWSQDGVQKSIKEAARRHDEMNTLKASVNSVKLLQDEESNYMQILELLKEGEVDIVFDRLESFKDAFLKVCLLILHECLIKSTINKEVVLNVCNEILNKIEDSTLDFPVYNKLLIYKYLIKLREYKIDYLRLVRKANFNFQDVLFLLEFECVDLDIVDKISNESIHISYLADIYLKIAFRCKKNSNTKKAFDYLDRSFEILKGYPISFGKYYEFTGFESEDIAFYENSLKTYLTISKLNFDLGRKKTSFESLEKAIDSSIKLSITPKNNENSSIPTNTLPGSGGSFGFKAEYCNKIFLLLLYLMKYEEAKRFYKTYYIDYELKSVYDDNWSNSLAGVKENIFNISSRFFLKHKNEKVFKDFLKFFDQIKRPSEKVGVLYYKINFLGYDLKNNKSFNSEIEIKDTLDKTPHSSDKFALYDELVFVLISNKEIQKAVLYINKIEELMNELADNNSGFYYTWVGRIIYYLIEFDYKRIAIELFEKYYSQIFNKNKNDSSKKYTLLRSLISYDKLLLLNSNLPEFISKKVNQIKKEKDYTFYGFDKIPEDLIEKIQFMFEFRNGSVENAISKAKFEKLDLKEDEINTSFGSTGFKLFLNYDLEIFPFNNENYGDPKSHEKKSIYNLSNISSQSLINYFSLYKNEKLVERSFVETELVSRGIFNYTLNNLIKSIGLGKKSFSFHDKKNNLPISEMDFNICQNLANKISHDKLISIINGFKFNNNIRLPFLAQFRNDYGLNDTYNNPKIYLKRDNGKIISVLKPSWKNTFVDRKLLFENGFLNVAIKCLTLKLLNKIDKKVISLLFDLCDSIKAEKGIGTKHNLNYSCMAYLQLANFLCDVNENEKSIEALELSFQIKEEGGIFEIGFPKYIDMVSIAISILIRIGTHEELYGFITRIISENNYLKKYPSGATFNKDYYFTEQLLSLFLHPLHHLNKKKELYNLIDTILKITNDIPGNVGSNIYDGELVRKELSISRVSYFLYTIGDYSKGDKYFNMLSKDLLSEQNQSFEVDEPKFLHKNPPNFIKPKTIDSKNENRTKLGDFDNIYKYSNEHFKYLSKNYNSENYYSFLFYTAKMNLFFSDKSNSDITNILKEVIDIDQWINLSKFLKSNDKY